MRLEVTPGVFVDATKEIIATMPDPFIVSNLMRQATIGNKRLRQSGKQLDKQLGYTEETLEKLYALAQSLYEKGKFQEAEKIFQQLYFLNPLDQKVAFGLAASAQRLGLWYKAIAFYGAASELDPKAVDPLYFSGECALQIGKEEAAAKYYSEAAKVCGKEERHKEIRDRSLALVESLTKRVKEGKPPLCLEVKNTQKSAS